MAWNEPGGDGKDPWNGGKQNPPDLDEVLKKLHKRFAKVFGGGGGDGEGSESGGAWLGFGLVATVLLVFWALSGIFIVGPAEEAAVLRFGKYVRTEGPGPHWIPRFINSKYIVNIQQVSTFTYTAEMLNEDENIVSATVNVLYRIDNPNNYLFNVVNPIESLRQATASSLRQVAGHTNLDDILTTGREKVRAEVEDVLRSTLKVYQTGIKVVEVRLKDTKPPEEVKSAFDDVNKAIEDEKRYKDKARAYEADKVPEAEGKAKEIILDAQAYREKRILIAKGDVAHFNALLPEYKRAPKVTRERLYLDALENVFGHTSKILVDGKGSQNLMYLPIDKILKKVNSNTVPNNAAAADAVNQLAALGARSRNSIIHTRPGRESYGGRGGY